MAGVFYIDGISSETFGVFVRDGGYSGLVSYPTMKAPDQNTWAEYDGVEVDLSEPKFDKREYKLSLVARQSGDIGAFIALLSDGVYHEFDFSDIMLTRCYRMVNVDGYTGNLNSIRTFDLVLSEDDPLVGYETRPNPAFSVEQNDYSIDDVLFSDYGVYILEGSDAEILKQPAVSQNLTVSTKNTNGVIYDGNSVKFQPKDVQLKCAIVADNISDFWSNYRSLFFDLSQPNERVFRFISEEYNCYLKGSECTKFSFVGGKIWCEFTLTICMTSFRNYDETKVLFTFLGKLIKTFSAKSIKLLKK
ncbi:MAG: hypothetical protein WCK78_04170 [Paludibacter sp.]